MSGTATLPGCTAAPTVSPKKRFQTMCTPYAKLGGERGSYICFGKRSRFAVTDNFIENLQSCVTGKSDSKKTGQSSSSSRRTFSLLCTTDSPDAGFFVAPVFLVRLAATPACALGVRVVFHHVNLFDMLPFGKIYLLTSW